MTQIIMGEVTPEYQAFVDKFKHRLTTDDCYTPPKVYEAAKQWACKEYGIDPERIVRPFWPGGDYQRFDYPDGAVVLDNPPFSIMWEIVPWYCQRGIRFFLFTPHTLGLKAYVVANRCTLLAACCRIEYSNGAKVDTAFLTNLEDKYIVRSAPELHDVVMAAHRKQNKAGSAARYEYPPEVVTAAMVGKYSTYGINFGVPYGEGVPIRELDAMRPSGRKSVWRRADGIRARRARARSRRTRRNGGSAEEPDQMATQRPGAGDRRGTGQTVRGWRHGAQAVIDAGHKGHRVPLFLQSWPRGDTLRGDHRRHKNSHHIPITAHKGFF